MSSGLILNEGDFTAAPMHGSTTIGETQERILVLLAQANDRQAFAELVRHYQRRLLYFIRRILGQDDDALDVMQEVWLTAFNKIGQLRSAEAFKVWLYKIARDTSVSHLRKRARWPAPLDEAAPARREDEAWDELSALEDVQAVHAALTRLSPLHSEVLTLRFLEGLELNEIAHVVGAAAGTVKSRLHYAKCELRHQLERTGDERKQT